MLYQCDISSVTLSRHKTYCIAALLILLDSIKGPGAIATCNVRGCIVRVRTRIRGDVSMAGIPTPSACAVLLLAAIAPLLAGCEEPASAVAAAQTSDPEVSIVAVRPQARAIVRELPGRVAPTRVSDVGGADV